MWTADNRPSRFTVNGSTVIDLYYDAAGRLARKDVNGAVASYFLWDGDHLFAELNGSDGNKRAEYSYYPGLDHLHALAVEDVRYYPHYDGQGNVIALTGEDQAVKRTYQYRLFGEYDTGTDPGGLAGRDRARWKGALWLGPEVELYYLRNRWYEPQSGRFLSEDPIGLGGGINPYTYAGNDPVNGRDPLGLSAACPDGGEVWWRALVSNTTGRIMGFLGWFCKGGGGSGQREAGGGTDAAFAAAAGDFNAMVADAREVLRAECSAGVMLAAGGAGAGVTEHTSIRTSPRGEEWLSPKTGRWYPTRNRPNGRTGSRNAVVTAGRQAQVAGQVLGAVAVGLTWYQAVGAFQEGDYGAAAWSTADGIVAGVGAFSGNPWIFGASLVYFFGRHLTSCGG